MQPITTDISSILEKFLMLGAKNWMDKINEDRSATYRQHRFAIADASSLFASTAQRELFIGLQKTD